MHLGLLIALSTLVFVLVAPKDLPEKNLAKANEEPKKDVGKIQREMELEQEWQSFKTAHGKSYADETEEKRRKQIFAENVETINSHNQLYAQGLKSYELGVNEFSDMEDKEFQSQMTGLSVEELSADNGAFTFQVPKDYTPPDEFDWRKKGFDTPVGKQANCKSCSTFAATGALEGHVYAKTKKNVGLSKQQLLDCVIKTCAKGAHVYDEFDYIKDKGGIDTEESYPYEAKAGKCRFDPSKIGATCSGYVRVTKGSESDLQAAVALKGPVAVYIYATYGNFQKYNGKDVFDVPHCPTTYDHAVLAVGYGTLNGKDYWIIKNSWGKSWADGGYGMISRNKKNQCGIGLYAWYPTI